MQRQSGRKLATATSVTVLLYTLAFAPFGAGFLAFVALAPVASVLLSSHAELRTATTMLCGAAFGAGACLAIVGYWSFLAAAGYFAQPAWMAALFTLALPLTASGVALYYAAAFPCLRALSRVGGTTPRILGFASVWTLVEAARGSLGLGNPWAQLGYAFSFSPLLAAPADLGGVWLLSWLAAAVSASVGVAWAERERRVEAARALALGASLLALQFGYGCWSLRVADEASSVAHATSGSVGPLHVGLVQAAIGKRGLWNPQDAVDPFERQIKLSRSQPLAGADLIVWPENATTFLMDANPERRARLQRLARELGAALLIGGSRSQPRAGDAVAIHNTAFLFPADGSEPLVYDKRVLMPYAEHVPAWAAALTGNPWQGAYAAGDAAVLFDVKGWKIAPLLCFETIYPSLAREAARSGADLLVNLSNDSWFDDGAGPEQHFAMARLRTIENHLPMLRVATTGISALVDGRGRVVEQLPSRREAVALVAVERGPGPSWFTTLPGATR